MKNSGRWSVGLSNSLQRLSMHLTAAWNTPQGQEMTPLEEELQEIRKAAAELGRRINLWKNRAMNSGIEAKNV